MRSVRATQDIVYCDLEKSLWEPIVTCLGEAIHVMGPSQSEEHAHQANGHYLVTPGVGALYGGVPPWHQFVIHPACSRARLKPVKSTQDQNLTAGTDSTSNQQIQPLARAFVDRSCCTADAAGEGSGRATPPIVPVVRLVCLCAHSGTCVGHPRTPLLGCPRYRNSIHQRFHVLSPPPLLPIMQIAVPIRRLGGGVHCNVTGQTIPQSRHPL
jgi:hypothetical protein